MPFGVDPFLKLTARVYTRCKVSENNHEQFVVYLAVNNALFAGMSDKITQNVCVLRLSQDLTLTLPFNSCLDKILQ